MSGTVTVKTVGRKFAVIFSRLPEREFGPWNFGETVRDLTVSALLPAMQARNLVLDACVDGSATAECGE